MFLFLVGTPRTVFSVCIWGMVPETGVGCRAFFPGGSADTCANVLATGVGALMDMEELHGCGVFHAFMMSC